MWDSGLFSSTFPEVIDNGVKTCYTHYLIFSRNVIVPFSMWQSQASGEIFALLSDLCSNIGLTGEASRYLLLPHPLPQAITYNSPVYLQVY